jgi:hypothetical protein
MPYGKRSPRQRPHDAASSSRVPSVERGQPGDNSKAAERAAWWYSARLNKYREIASAKKSAG